MSVTKLAHILDSIIDNVDPVESNLAELYAVQEAYKEAREDGYLTEEVLVNFIRRATTALDTNATKRNH
jgi:hypothetical protein